jgi:hypothetical protein
MREYLTHSERAVLSAHARHVGDAGATPAAPGRVESHRKSSIPGLTDAGYRAFGLEILQQPPEPPPTARPPAAPGRAGQGEQR